MTADLTIAGYRILDGTIRMLRRGAWIADLVSDEAPETITGAVPLVAPGASLAGFVVRAGSFSVGMTDRTGLRVVGGGGGLSTVMPPKAYRAITPAALVASICKDAGETASSMSTFPPGTLDAWMRARGTAGEAFDAICDRLGIAMWRVLDDGSIWFGADAYAVSPLDTADPAATIMDTDDAVGWMTIALDSLDARPGQLVFGKRATSVEHRITVEGLRSEVLYA